MKTWTDRKRILIAEDDSLVREVLRMRLGTAGYDVHAAHTGSEALQKIPLLKPAALVLDLGLPGVDGFGVMEALNKDYARLNIPVMVLSARRNEADVKRALELGARDYVLKAEVEVDLLKRIRRLLTRPSPDKDTISIA
jgi:DNA-binding response OmpR family regulator